MKPTKTQIDDSSRTGAEVAGRNPAMAAAGVEVESATLARTKAQSQEVDLMEQVLMPANLEKAYRRVCANQGSAGVDGIGLSEFEAHLRRHWPTVKAKPLEMIEGGCFPTGEPPIGSEKWLEREEQTNTILVFSCPTIRCHDIAPQS